MKKQLLFLTILTMVSLTSHAQFTWYSNGGGDIKATFGGDSRGDFSADETNPATGGINTQATSSKFVADGSAANASIYFELPNPILLADVASTVIKLKFYFTDISDLPSAHLDLRLRNSASGGTGQVIIGQTLIADDNAKWVEYTYDFSGASATEVQYDRVYFFLSPGSTSTIADGKSFYIDELSGNTTQGSTAQGIPAEAVLDANNLWYHNYSPDVYSATTGTVVSGTFTTDETSPDILDNSSALVSKFVKTEGVHSLVTFDLPGTITDIADAIFKIRVYTVGNSTITNNNIKMILRSDGVSNGQLALVKEVTKEDEWVEYTFDFSSSSFTGDPIVTSFNQVILFFAQPDTDFDATGNVYYVDAFQGPTEGTVLSVSNTDLDTIKLNVYPTNVTDSFSIDAEIISAEIYNMTGQKIKEFGVQSEFNVSDLVSGVYIFNATLSNGVIQTVRFIKE